MMSRFISPGHTFPRGSVTFKERKKLPRNASLPFTILSDAGAKVAKAYGVYGMKTFMGRKFMGVKRTTFLIDEKGRIVKVIPKLDVKHHANEVLEGFKVSTRKIID